MTIQPYWVSGFVDGEGTFYVGINKNSTMKIGYQVLPEFRVVQHEKDVVVLHALKKFFNCGVVRVNHGDRMEYRVRSVKHLSQIIIPFFDKHPLITQKKFDYITFRKIVFLMKENKHLNEKGLQRILTLSRTMNRKNKFRTPTTI